MRITRVLIICLSTFVLGYLDGQDGGSQVKIDAKTYRELVKRLQACDTTIDFRVLRLCYTKTAKYCPYVIEDIELYKTMFDNYRVGDFPRAIENAKAILYDHYVDFEAQKVCADAYEKLGDSVNSRLHRKIYEGLLNSILRTGDGKTFETAYEVVRIQEEWAVIGHFDYTFDVAAMVKHGKSWYDAVEVADWSVKEKKTIYFNIDLPYKYLKKKIAAMPPWYRALLEYLYNKGK